MSANPDVLPIVVPVKADSIPIELRQAKRWVAWMASWEGGKFNKRPGRVDKPGVGLKDWAASGWVDFDTAMRAYQENRGVFGGVGYVMSGSHGITGVDLDHCITDGKIEPWAAEIVAKLDSYTERSPSGKGLRVFISGDLEDWTNIERGIEVYGGGRRFLTVTGDRIDGAPLDVRAPRPGVLDNLAARYKRASKAPVEDLHLPRLLGDDELPDLCDLDLPPHARNFLTVGPEPGDRSRQLFAAAVALAQAGLTREELFSMLAANDYAMEVAADHWKGSHEKALRYLWKHSATTGAARAGQIRQLQLDDFDSEPDPIDDLSDLLGPSTPEQAARPAGQVSDVYDDFDDLGDGDQHQQATTQYDLSPVKKKKKDRFQFENVASFLRRPAPRWIVRGVLPQAELAIVFGASGSGKTFFVVDMAVSISTGRAWRGLPVAQGGVAYVVAEGAGGFRDRLQAYCHQYELDAETLPIHVLADAPNMMVNEDVKDLAAQLKTLGPLSIVVMDTYARVMSGGNENEAKDVNKVVAHCQLLHKLTGAMVVLIHHSGKDSANGARGSSALRGAADAEIEIVKTKNYREAATTKMKDGEEGAKFRFKLASVVIGFDEDMEERTSCVVEHIAAENTSEAPPPAKPLGPVQARIIDVLGEDIGGEVEREAFILRVRDATPTDASGREDSNWKMKITRPLKKMIEEGLVIDASGMLSLPKTTCN